MGLHQVTCVRLLVWLTNTNRLNGYCCLMDGDSKSATRASGHKWLGAVPCNILYVSEAILSLDHIARRDSTQQNCFVELNRVRRCDHFKDSTRQNSFVELSRVGRCYQGFKLDSLLSALPMQTDERVGSERRRWKISRTDAFSNNNNNSKNDCD